MSKKKRKQISCLELIDRMKDGTAPDEIEYKGEKLYFEHGAYCRETIFFHHGQPSYKARTVWAFPLNCDELKINNIKIIKDYSILDDVEKKYLRGILRPFKDKKILITKHCYEGLEYLKIIILQAQGSGSCVLPAFESGTMYKNMEVDRRYTPKQLGLWG